LYTIHLPSIGPEPTEKGGVRTHAFVSSPNEQAEQDTAGKNGAGNNPEVPIKQPSKQDLKGRIKTVRKTSEALHAFLDKYWQSKPVLKDSWGYESANVEVFMCMCNELADRARVCVCVRMRVRV